MLHRERVIGVLSLGRSADEDFTPAEIARLKILVESATLACAEALSLRRLEVLATELEWVMGLHRPGHRPGRPVRPHHLYQPRQGAGAAPAGPGRKCSAGTRTP